MLEGEIRLCGSIQLCELKYISLNHNNIKIYHRWHSLIVLQKGKIYFQFAEKVICENNAILN